MNISHQFTLSRDFLVATMLILSVPAAGRCDDALRKVFEECKTSACSIASIEYGCTLTCGGPWCDGTVVHYTYAEMGGKIRVDERGMGDNPSNISAAFNGELFQRLDRDHGVLTVNSLARFGEAEFGFEPPQHMLFAWLFDARPRGTNADWSKVFDIALWNSRFSDATYIDDRNATKDGIVTLTFPGRRRRSPDCEFVVDFARQFGYMPVRVIFRACDTHEIYSDTNAQYESFSGPPEKQLFFPVTAVYSQAKVAGVSEPLSFNYRMERASIKINRPIDNARFTLDRSSVREVVDVDALALDTAILPTGAPASRPTRGSRMWLIAANVAVVGLLLAWLAMRNIAARK